VSGPLRVGQQKRQSGVLVSVKGTCKRRMRRAAIGEDSLTISGFTKIFFEIPGYINGSDVPISIQVMTSCKF